MDQKIDQENMRQVILDSPSQLTQGLALAKDIKIPSNFNSIVISGMGGSALPGDILKIYLDDLFQKNSDQNSHLTVLQNRTYALPAEAYKNSLNIFASYSGNTEETLSSLEEALKAKLPAIGISSGGKLAEICQKNNIPLVSLPAGIQPRCASGYFFSAILGILAKAEKIENPSENIAQAQKKLSEQISDLEKQGAEIAKKLFEKIPIIYASEKFRALAMIWKIKINENAKTPAFYNSYPELNHNEMVGFTLPQGKFHLINLTNQTDHPQTLKRINITSEILAKKNIQNTRIEMNSSNILDSIFSTLLLGDWVSYYLALEYGQDPTPVAMVENLKQQLT
ncbi:MAG: bifunctional phosphoglucose/phosphomannose isomerase [Candidatus Moranbacteria bacterium CG10_big_fil_rev_8_21_14_0_10_35_21]|nr:MAG: bifunctional phosphoglucose/phosphomannose isomerase [Candidatus Moranbacteria bacterium CG10_big_fil_rev_8_21_14_0_10_35_21]PJA88448.1 MAG: bifunctional phosphoglucose/phosphomannose isomerase [Candidatus Moranbacteria bacterium CG_4_9_14_3_um_filter_36_9]